MRPNPATATQLALPAPEKTTRDKPKSETSGAWHVLVLNDPVNLMSYVTMVFRKVFGFDLAKARKHMLEVHEKGRSIVWTGDREKAEAYVHTLHAWKLAAKLERDG